jgi:hypothetical protein
MEMDDLPQTYGAERVNDRCWLVTYGPDDEPFAFIIARDGQPDADSKHRAKMLARVMNATCDMGAATIRQLLEAYENHWGHRHHADWRGEPDD